ncbi:MAG: hypothetical protein OXC65_05800 [Thiotrichales bacterium]|nr:hypothetical protein [Thiotrichales bacterium]
MTQETHSQGSYGRATLVWLGWRIRLMVLATVVLPVTVSADTVLNERDMFHLLDVVVAHYYKKDVERWNVEAACYFDPQVENSMSCSWRTGGGGADPHWLRQRVKQDGVKWCKKNGGKSCVLLWRNGKLVFDSLLSGDAAKFRSIAGNIPGYDTEATPLPEGVEVAQSLQDRSPKILDYWEKRKKRRKPNYAVCASDVGPWTSSYQEGGQTKAGGLKSVRAMCMLECRAAMEWFGRDGDCYLVFENGQFASAAARRALIQ